MQSRRTAGGGGGGGGLVGAPRAAACQGQTGLTTQQEAEARSHPSMHAKLARQGLSTGPTLLCPCVRLYW